MEEQVGLEGSQQVDLSMHPSGIVPTLHQREQMGGIEMETKDPLKGVDWRAVGSELQKDPSAKSVIRKCLPKKIRQIPECYFLPRRSLPSALAFYRACIAGGVGAGLLLEIWINKKVKEDEGVIWEFDK